MNDTTAQAVAIFDFDDTLIHGDSLVVFLIALAGKTRFVSAGMLALARALLVSGKSEDFRTRIKSRLLGNMLSGYKLSDIAPAVTETVAAVKWHQGYALEALHAHHERGDRIVIASGGLDLYLPTLLKKLPVDDIICTRMTIHDSVITGEISGDNCVRQGKLRAVREYLQARGQLGQLGHISGYGNWPHDKHFLALASRRVIV